MDYGAAICMRGDLAAGGTGRAGGCYDTKVTSFLHGALQLRAEAVSGPSSRASTDSQYAPFAWRPAVDNTTTHAGLPQTFDFDFVKMAPASWL